MKEPLTKMILGDFDNNENTVTLSVFEEFIEIVVSLSLREDVIVMSNGGVASERKALNILLRKIFNQPYEGLILFSNEKESEIWQKSVSFDTSHLQGTHPSKTAIILLDTTNYELSLERAVIYIKNCYDNFNNPSEKKRKIAESVLDKYFKK